MALRVVPTLLYGKGHPYAVPFTGSGTEASVKQDDARGPGQVPRDLVQAQQRALCWWSATRRWPKSNPSWRNFWPRGSRAMFRREPCRTWREPEKDVVYLIDRPGSGQSVIFGAQLAPPQNDPDAIALQLVNGIFGGKFSSRINMNLREDKHWSYGVRAVLPPARGQRPYISISRGADRQDQRIHGGVGQGIQRHRGRKADHRGRAEG